MYGLLSVLVGLTLMVSLDAPQPVTAMVVVMFGIGLAVTATNLAWKLSIHAAVAAGSAAVLIIEFGTALLASLLVVALVGWSRVRLHEHTPARDSRRHSGHDRCDPRLPAPQIAASRAG